MKRHQNLAPLSREHHGALILARLLKKNAPDYKDLPALPEAKSVYAINYYHQYLMAHFKKEEQMLEMVKGYHGEITLLADEIIKEHHQLNALFTALNESAVSETALDILGTVLENHIRKEERVLFPLIQQYCPEAILETIEL